MFLIAVGIAIYKDMPKDVDEKTKKLNSTARMFVGAILGDAFLSITALVVGILGIVGVLHGLPPAAAYTLIGISGFITLYWTVMTVFTKGQAIIEVKKLLIAAVSSDPKLLKI